MMALEQTGSIFFFSKGKLIKFVLFAKFDLTVTGLIHSKIVMVGFFWMANYVISFYFMLGFNLFVFFECLGAVCLVLYNVI